MKGEHNTMNTPPNPNVKLRPYLSPQQINYILDLCSQDQREATFHLRKQITASLQLVTMKLELGLSQGSYTATPRVTVAEKLGFSESDLSPAAKREAAYMTYRENPSLCTQYEIKLARTYMYENGMMTPQEAEEFEK